MFDSREYEWADVTITVGGTILTKVQGVEYRIAQEKELLYGKGSEPMSIQKGNKSYSGTLTLLQSAIDSLTLAGGSDGMLGLSVDVTVSYGNPSKGDVIRTDLLMGCQFTEEPRSINQGDKNMLAQSCPFIFLRKKRIV